ncbi:MAG: DNA-binding protein WhiA [Oscillospiraceae bacterium]|nr:DNA-binding protein WhiA [Oscillospiraceae bacterium]
MKIEIYEAYKMPDSCKTVLLYGIFSAARIYSETEIEILSESKDIAYYTSKLIGRLYRVNIPVLKIFNSEEQKKELYQVKIIDTRICKTICDSYNCGKYSDAVGLISLDESITWAFIKGIFLGCGSVSDPETEYHLEFAFRRKNDAFFAQNMLTSLGFSPKITIRRESYLVYFKDSTSIEDILTGMGAVKHALRLMDSKVLKDLRNRLNRRNNCETANMQKTISAAMEQTKAIRYIITKRGIDYLSEDLQRIAEVRVENPEMSLSAMANELSGEFSKSAIDRKLKKIVSIAEEIKQQIGKG